jgi:hypothetical protein
LFLFVNFLLGIKTRIIAANTQNINDWILLKLSNIIVLDENRYRLQAYK